MRKRADEEGFLDSFEILLASTNEHLDLLYARGDPDIFKLGYDILKNIYDTYINSEEEEKDDEEKERSKGGTRLLNKAVLGDLEEGQYTWNGSVWVRQ